LAPDIRHERNVILQCIRFLTQHYQLHEKDRQYRQRQADSQPSTSAPVICDSQVQSSGSDSVHSAENKSFEDRHSKGSSNMTPDVMVKTGNEAIVDDVPHLLSGDLCGILENTVSNIDSVSNSDICECEVPVNGVVSVTGSTADTSITQCNSENGDVNADRITLCNNGTGVVIDDTDNTSAHLSSRNVNINAERIPLCNSDIDDLNDDTSNTAVKFVSGTVDIAAETSDTHTVCHNTADVISDSVSQHNNNISDMIVNASTKDTQCNVDICDIAADANNIATECSNCTVDTREVPCDHNTATVSESGLSLIMSNYAGI